MRPANVDIYNAARARENLSKRARANYSWRKVSTHGKFNVGDLVRISRTNNTFKRGYEKNFSEEIFKITRVSYRQGLHTYILQDLNDEIIDGFFYKEELVRVGQERLASIGVKAVCLTFPRTELAALRHTYRERSNYTANGS